MLNKRIRTLRLYNKYTQQNMADLLNMTLGAYQKYEQGDTKPPLETLVLLADIFNIPVDYLLGRDEYLKSIGIEINIPEAPMKKKKKIRQKSDAEKTDL